MTRSLRQDGSIFTASSMAKKSTPVAPPVSTPEPSSNTLRTEARTSCSTWAFTSRHVPVKSAHFIRYSTSSASRSSRRLSSLRSMDFRRASMSGDAERWGRSKRSKRSSECGRDWYAGRSNERGARSSVFGWKQSRQRTGRVPLGKNGTLQALPQSLQTASCSSRGAGLPAPARFHVPFGFPAGAPNFRPGRENEFIDFAKVSRVLRLCLFLWCLNAEPDPSQHLSRGCFYGNTPLSGCARGQHSVPTVAVWPAAGNGKSG